MARLDPLQRVYQGQAGTGAAVIYDTDKDASKRLYDVADKISEAAKLKAKKPVGKGKLMDLTPTWDVYQNTATDLVNAFNEGAASLIAQGQDIDQNPLAQQKKNEVIGLLSNMGQMKDLYEQSTKQVSQMYKEGKLDEDTYVGWVEQANSWKDLGKSGLDGLQQQMDSIDALNLPQPQEEEEVPDYYKTLSGAFGAASQYAKETVIESGDITTTNILPNKDAISAQAQAFVDSPASQKWVDTYYGGDKLKAKGAAEQWVTNQVKSTYKRAEDEPKGGMGAVTDDDFYDRNKKIYYLQKYFQFKDSADKEQSKTALGALIGGKTSTGAAITDANFVKSGGKNKKDIIELTTVRVVGGSEIPGGKVQIDLTDPASYAEINEIINSNTDANFKIQNEKLEKWNAEKGATFNVPLLEQAGYDEQQQRLLGLREGLQAKDNAARGQFVGKQYNGKVIASITETKPSDKLGFMGRSALKAVGLPVSLTPEQTGGDIEINYADGTKEVISSTNNEAVQKFVDSVMGGDSKEATPEKPKETKTKDPLGLGL